MRVHMDIAFLLEKAYGAFNARDIETALAVMHRAVDWPRQQTVAPHCPRGSFPHAVISQLIYG
jgi:hypothetical protein